jgi:hypothetical protein
LEKTLKIGFIKRKDLLMFNFKKVQEQRLEFKRGKFIRPGVQNLTFRDVTLEESKNTGNKRPVFFMETEPITDEGWEPHEDAQAGGQIGKVAGNAGYYLKNDDQQEEFVGLLKTMMSAVGTLDQFMSEHGTEDYDNLDDVVAAVKPYLTGRTGRFFVCGEQYQKLDNSGVGLRLKFPNKRVVESINVAIEDSKLPKFDESNPTHFKKLPRQEEPKEMTSDLPF